MSHGRSGSFVLGGLAAALTLLAASVASAQPRPEHRSAQAGAIESFLRRKIEGMTLEEKVGQMFMTYAYGQSVEDAAPAMVAANRRDHGVDTMKALIEKYQLGGVIYFAWSNNVNNPHQITRLSNGVQDVATGQRPGVPALISTDQEQGIVVRVGEPATQFPGNMALGAARSAEHARTAAAITGQELRAMGINQDMAPVADVNVNAQNPVIGVRSFSEDSSLVSSLTAAQVEGYESQHVSATAKHFPGHGDTNVDSHTGLPVIDHSRQELNTIDLPPFRAAIGSGTESIMTAHIVVPALDDSERPATLSKPILTDLLRKEMGFDGVIVTDALTMEGVRQMFGDDRVPVEAIKAGADILLMPPKIDVAYNSVLRAVESGEIGEGRINQSVYRILRMKHRLGLFDDPYADEAAVDAVVGTPAHLAAADAITKETVTLVKNDAGTLPLQPESGQNALVTGWGVTTTATLAGYLDDRGLQTEVYETGANPDDAQVQKAKRRAEANDLAIVTTNRAWTSGGQQKLVKALVGTGKPVIVVATRDPYDIAYFTEADTYAATYSYTRVSLEALTKVLFGEVDPSGKLPVTIPRADDPNSALYPFGHGLSYGG